MGQPANRRPLKSRQTAWAQAAARALARSGVSPNAISVAGIAFAAVGAGAFLLTGQSRWYWLVGALFVQLRLLANLFDGLVAIEGRRQSPTGVLFNEFPDRIEDSLLLVAAGYAAGLPAIGWCAALLAAGTAYVRALGGAIGLAQDFGGPMAKPQRMALLTLGGATSVFVPVMPAVLAVICAGAALTCWLRLRRQAAALKLQAK